MKQKSNKRLYFTNDFSPENVKKLQSEGYILRKASAYHEADTLEPCAEVAGEVPQAYIDLTKRTKSSVVVGKVEVGITPELQATIDQAKAECEKVVAENADLKEQLDKEREAVKKLDLENADLKEQLLTAEKTLLAADDEIKVLKDRVTHLQKPLASGGASAGSSIEAKPKKPTAAEVKAAKADEEDKTTEPPKE